MDIALYEADIRIPLAELLCVIRSLSVSVMYSCPLQLLLRINEGPKDQAGAETTHGSGSLSGGNKINSVTKSIIYSVQTQLFIYQI